MDWTEDAIGLLRRMWDAGSPTSAIASALGTTRNSVIGKADRLSLPRRPSPLTPEGRIHYGLGLPGSPVIEPVPAPVRIPLPPAKVHVPDVFGAPKAVSRNRPDSCRWPLGDPKMPSFRFCGRSADGGAYCSLHAGMSYLKPKAQASAGRSR